MAIFTGVFTDADHILDYVEPRQGSFLKYMTRPFHAWEFLIIGIGILLGVGYHPLFLAGLIGYSSHILVDQLGNQTHPLAYFISYRAAKKFRRRHLTPQLYTGRYRFLPDDAPWWARVETRWYKLYLRMRDRRSSETGPS